MTNQTIPTLTGTRIILRPLTLNDASDIFAYANNPAVAQYVFWEPHTSIEDTKEFLKTILNSKELMWGIQLKDEKKIIGTCGFIAWNNITKCLTIGYALQQDYWQKGYTKEALQMIISYGFSTLNAIRIEGICVVGNTGSEKTMLSCGMEFEGILHDNFIKGNKISDTKIFAITKRNYLKNAKK